MSQWSLDLLCFMGGMSVATLYSKNNKNFTSKLLQKSLSVYPYSDVYKDVEFKIL